MGRFSYPEQDYAFGQRALTLRTEIGLTPESLAERWLAGLLTFSLETQDTPPVSIRPADRLGQRPRPSSFLWTGMGTLPCGRGIRLRRRQDRSG